MTGKINKLFEGMSHSHSFVVTKEMMDGFLSISNDTNKLHTDEDFAKINKFDGVVVYGGLIIAQISYLIGVHLPGENSIWNGLRINFKSPLMVNTLAILKATITHVSEATSSVEIKFDVTSEDNIIASGSVGVTII
jgi:acyl dehydratase